VSTPSLSCLTSECRRFVAGTDTRDAKIMLSFAGGPSTSAAPVREPVYLGFLVLFGLFLLTCSLPVRRNTEARWEEGGRSDSSRCGVLVWFSCSL
jgi:hypothetical protein